MNPVIGFGKSVLGAALHRLSPLRQPPFAVVRRGGREDKRTDGGGRKGKQMKTNTFFVFSSLLQTDK